MYICMYVGVCLSVCVLDYPRVPPFLVIQLGGSPASAPLGDAAVTRTEKLRELRQEISKVVQHIGASQLGNFRGDFSW